MNRWVVIMMAGALAAVMELAERDPRVADLVSRAARQAMEELGEVDCGWQANPGPQMMAFSSEADEVLYGGAAGGGKSELCLGLARLKHRNCVIFRRTYPQLEDSVIPRSKEIFGDPRKRYNDSKHVWQFADGCAIRFRHLEREADVFGHQSAQYDFIAFDELTQFTRKQYEYLISRNRTTRPGQRCRMVAATNPGGEGNDWVMERWAPWLRKDHPKPARNGELRWFVRIGDAEQECGGPEPVTDPKTGEELFPRSRTFIPAFLSDNPYLGQDYRAKLQSMPEPYRSQLLNGDWQAGLVDDAWQVIPRRLVQAAMARWRPDGAAGPVSHVGADVARGGSDRMVVCARNGNWVAPLRVFPGVDVPDGPSGAMRIAEVMDEGATAYVDVIGVGAAVVDHLRGLKLSVEPVNVAESCPRLDATGHFGFENVRASLIWAVREALDPDLGGDLALPPDPELEAELCSFRWKAGARGVALELKDKTSERLGRSPDKADGLAFSYAGPSVDRVFPLAGPRLGSPEPEIVWRRGEWFIRRGWMSRLGQTDWPGSLCRAMWHARHGENKALWVHIDEDCWTVFRAISTQGSLAEFLARVSEASRDDGRLHDYAIDVFGADVGGVRRGNRSILDDVRDQFADWSPQLMEGSQIAGAAGLSRIEDLILGTMARWPEEACWKGREDESARYASGEMLAIAPAAVLDELQRAYYRPQAARAAADDPVQTPVGGGGGFTRCLRLLAVAGAGAEPTKSGGSDGRA